LGLINAVVVFLLAYFGRIDLSVSRTWRLIPLE